MKIYISIIKIIDKCFYFILLFDNKFKDIIINQK